MLLAPERKIFWWRMLMAVIPSCQTEAIDQLRCLLGQLHASWWIYWFDWLAAWLNGCNDYSCWLLAIVYCFLMHILLHIQNYPNNFLTCTLTALLRLFINYFPACHSILLICVSIYSFFHYSLAPCATFTWNPQLKRVKPLSNWSSTSQNKDEEESQIKNQCGYSVLLFIIVCQPRASTSFSPLQPSIDLNNQCDYSIRKQYGLLPLSIVLLE